MKLDAPAPVAPAEPISEPANDAGFDGLDNTEPAPEGGLGDDKPFDDEPFDAGVEADESTDPKKYIEQLTGKLGQSLRKYTQEQGQPDFALEKFAINSVLAATNSSEMDEEDKNDIIKKINTAGQSDNDDSNDDEPMDDEPMDDVEMGGELGGELEEVNILEFEEMFLKNPKKVNMFQPNSNDVLKGTKDEVFESKKPVLIKSKKRSIFDKNYLKISLQESFNQEDMTTVEPKTKPTTKPIEAPTAPSRRNKPFLPNPSAEPDPKAVDEGVWGKMMKGVKGAEYGGPWTVVAIKDKKVVGQATTQIRDLIPAEYEAMKKKYENSLIYIENSAGMVVWTNRK